MNRILPVQDQRKHVGEPYGREDCCAAPRDTWRRSTPAWPMPVCGPRPSRGGTGGREVCRSAGSTWPAPGSASRSSPFNGSRIDRRIHAGNWCNQSGAGLGQRPTAAPAAGIDAHVWVKPPGESDGSSSAVPNDQGKGFDRMCDPTYGGNARKGNNPTGALPNAPQAGRWFSAQFQQLMQNAYPPLP
jgi:cellulose 1,4-beta-cellobiosidase